MHVKVAEERTLPAAEGEEGHRHGYRNIHSDHADVHLFVKAPRRTSGVREDGGAIAVGVGIDHLDRFIDGIGAQHGQDGTEDLVAINAHLGFHAIEQRRAEVEAALIAGNVDVAAVDHQPRALPDARVDVACHLVAVGRGNERPHVYAFLVARADHDLLRALLDLADDSVAYAANGNHRRDRHAALAGGAVRRADDGVRGEIKFGVGQHHRVVLGAAEGLHALAVARRLLVDVLGDRRRTDERHGADARVGEDGVNRFLVPLDHVENAVGQPRFLQQFRDHHRWRRVLFRWLENERIAAGDRHRRHPHRNHHGEVEGSNAGAYPDRLADAERVHGRPDVFRVFALQELRDPAGELGHLQPPLNRAHRVGECLAVLFRHQPCKRLLVPLHEFHELLHHPRTAQRRCRRPAR